MKLVRIADPANPRLCRRKPSPCNDVPAAVRAAAHEEESVNDSQLDIEPH
jgi:hypothetical protein